MHGHGHRYGYDTATRAIFGKLYHDMTNRTPRGGGKRAKGGGGGGAPFELSNFFTDNIIMT